jgi:hypothetical protein
LNSWLLPGDIGIMTKYFRAGFNQGRSGVEGCRCV